MMNTNNSEKGDTMVYITETLPNDMGFMVFKLGYGITFDRKGDTYTGTGLRGNSEEWSLVCQELMLMRGEAKGSFKRSLTSAIKTIRNSTIEMNMYQDMKKATIKYLKSLHPIIGNKQVHPQVLDRLAESILPIKPYKLSKTDTQVFVGASRMPQLQEAIIALSDSGEFPKLRE